MSVFKVQLILSLQLKSINDNFGVLFFTIPKKS